MGGNGSGSTVELTDANGNEAGSDSLWGIKSDGDYWREVAADLVNGLCAEAETKIAAAEVIAAAEMFA